MKNVCHEVTCSDLSTEAFGGRFRRVIGVVSQSDILKKVEYADKNGKLYYQRRTQYTRILYRTCSESSSNFSIRSKNHDLMYDARIDRHPNCPISCSLFQIHVQNINFNFHSLKLSKFLLKIY